MPVLPAQCNASLGALPGGRGFGFLPMIRFWLALWQRARTHRLDTTAASVAFFALMAMFPALSLIAALYGLIGHPGDVSEQVQILEGLAPPAVSQLAQDQLMRLVSAPSGALATGALISLGLSLWSASRGVAGFRQALFVIDEKCGPPRAVRQTLGSLALTLGAVATASVAFAILAILPLTLKMLEASAQLESQVRWLRWPVLFAATTGYAAVLYRWGVNRSACAWRHVWRGAGFAAVLWIAVSAGLAAFVTQSASLSATYGSLTGLVILLLWGYLTAYTFLIGAEVSYLLEARAEGL